MKRIDISAGDQLVLSNGTVEVVYNVNNVLYVSPRGSHYLSFKLEDICDPNLRPIGNCAQIKEIRNVNNLIIWTEPVEMTISEIEKALKLTPGTLRIKK